MSIQPIPIEVFYSYAREDEVLRNELEKHLSILHRQGLVSSWHDRKIVAGTDWKKDIDTHLEKASLILLLVSSDFLASDYSYGIEIKRALERHQTKDARVIPILLRPVVWRGAPFGHLQMLPTDGKPVTEWNNQDAAFQDIAAGIQQTIEDLFQLNRRSSPHTIVQQYPYHPSNSSIIPPPPRSKVLRGPIAITAALLALLLIFTGIGLIILFKSQASNIPKSQTTVSSTQPPQNTPTLIPTIETPKYTAVSPGCERSDPSDITWTLTSAINLTCLPNDTGVKLDQLDKELIPELKFQPSSDQERLASNYTAEITVAQVASNVCVGFLLHVQTHSPLSYGLFICGDGDWYLAKYLADTGGGTILMQSTSATREQASDHYNLQIGVYGSMLQMFVGGQVHSAQDPELVSTASIGIGFGQEGALTSFVAATSVTSIIVSKFSYRNDN